MATIARFACAKLTGGRMDVRTCVLRRARARARATSGPVRACRSGWWVRAWSLGARSTQGAYTKADAPHAPTDERVKADVWTAGTAACPWCCWCGRLPPPCFVRCVWVCLQVSPCRRVFGWTPASLRPLRSGCTPVTAPPKLGGRVSGTWSLPDHREREPPRPPVPP